MWTELTASEQLNQLHADSKTAPQLIFKHSTRCSISRVALSRFDRTSLFGEGVNYYLLDLLNHRALSQAITELYGITHESPQVLIVHAGKCIFHANHLDIDPAEIQETISGRISESL